MTVSPLLDPLARRAATMKASATRQARSGLKRATLLGELDVTGWYALADSDPTGVAARTRVVEVVRAVPGLRDRERATRWLEQIRLSPTRTVKGLGRRQRERLAGAVDAHLRSTAS